MTNRTFEQWIQEAQAFRAAAMKAEGELLIFLVGFEKSGTWRDAGFNTFEMTIRQYKLTRPERFAEFKAARGVVPAKKIAMIGVGATLQAAKIPNAQTRAAYVREAELRVEADGFPWSDAQAEQARQRVAPDAPREPMRVGRENRAKSALQEAHAVIARQREEIATLKAENRELRKQLGKKAA